VEVFYNETWGTVCDDRWDIDDATVVCRQLGYSNALRVLEDDEVEDGTGEIWLDEVACTGSEQNLASCSHNGWSVTDCDHSEDTGVECLTPGNILVRFIGARRPMIGSSGVNCQKVL
jgi:hypothetical protein